MSTPNGPFWHRFSFDGYGETRDGGQWKITDPDTGTTLGRGWPLLTGERGEYAVTAGGDGQRYLRTMARSAGPSRHGRRAGLGRPRADRRARAAPRARAPGPRRRWSGRTPVSSGSRGRSSAAPRSTSRGWWPGATCAELERGWDDLDRPSCRLPVSCGFWTTAGAPGLWWVAPGPVAEAFDDHQAASGKAQPENILLISSGRTTPSAWESVEKIYSVPPSPARSASIFVSVIDLRDATIRVRE